MSVSLSDIVDYLAVLLEPQQFNDACPNGLQVEGCQDIHTLITGVTACRALIEMAAAEKSQALLVHHGYFWRGESTCLVGTHGERVRQLMRNNISLLAYHLPLDVHATLGNNVQLAKVLDFIIDGHFSLPRHQPSLLGCKGRLPQPLSGQSLANLLNQRLKRNPLYIPGHSSVIKTIGWCTGAAQDFITYAADAGLDAYLTGEASERTFHLARELGVHFYVAGHHATERYGVAALGEHLAQKFNLTHRFIDIDNPI